MEILKNYPCYTFVNDTGKKVDFRMDGTSELRGFSGRLVKAVPAPIAKSDKVVAFLISRIYNPDVRTNERTRYLARLEMMDKLISLNPAFLSLCCTGWSYDTSINDIYDIYHTNSFKNFSKYFIQYFKDHPDTNALNRNLQAYLFSMCYCAKHNITVPENVDCANLYQL